jgi:bifunctional non-homologous end joining protein LigD
MRDVPDDPLDWRPQEPLVTRTPVTIRDPVVEPLWTGERVLVHVDHPKGARVRMIDRYGIDLAPVDADIAAAIGEAVLADDAILDGVLTADASRAGVGTAIVPEAHRPTASSLLGSIAGEPGITVTRRGDEEPAGPEAFVAFDLLHMDGQSLLDVPLLERHRLLESVVAQGSLVRVSVLCRPPIDPWVATWQASGLRGGMLKTANGRYVPGDRTPEWRAVTKIASRR